MALSEDDVREILRIVADSPLRELRIETDGFSLHVRRDAPDVAATQPSAPIWEASPPSSEASPRISEDSRPNARRDGADLLTIQAPMLGVFYRAEGPREAPLVEAGSRVEPDTIVCIIEVMKMMNSVPAGLSGTIVEVCPENAEIVEEGAPLFRVRPS
jgi:acetyl-CoA carboxylase biotin carboxyl carrier protein